MHSIAFQYTSGLTPFVFVSAIFGLATVLRRVDKIGSLTTARNVFFGFILITSLVLAGRPERDHFVKYSGELNEHKEMVKKHIARIPGHLSVVVNERLAPHLSHRFDIQQFEDFQRMRVAPTYPLEADVVIIDRELTVGSARAEAIKIQASGYEIAYEQDGFFILQRADQGESISDLFTVESNKGKFI